MFSTLRSWRQDRLLRGIVKNSSYLFSSSSAAIVLTMFQGIFTARLLGAYEYGVLAGVVIPIVSDAHQLVSFRMSELVVKYVGQFTAEDRKDRAAAVVKAAALVEALMSVLAYLGLLALAPLAASYLAKDTQAASLFGFYGLVLFGNVVYETSLGVVQSYRRFNRLALINLLQSVITASLIFLAYLLQRGMLEVLLAYLLGKAFAGLALGWVAFRLLSTELGPGWWRASFRLLPPRRELFRFALSTNLSATVNLVVRNNETVLISFLRSPLEAGYYKIALGVINLVMLPIEPFIAPTYAEITGTISQRLYGLTRSLLKRVSLIAGVWTIGAAAFLILFGWWAVPFVYGAEYGPAYPALAILLVGYGFANILHWNRPLLLALGLPDYPLKVSAGVGALKTAATFLVVPVYGYVAEAVIQSLYFLASIGINVWRGMGELRQRGKREEAGPGSGEAAEPWSGPVRPSGPIQPAAPVRPDGRNGP